MPREAESYDQERSAALLHGTEKGTAGRDGSKGMMSALW